jgi:outer membrane protein assembly factor BamD (BamD/ComL family)
MRGLVIIAALIIFIGGYFILGSDKIGNYIEQYSIDKIKDPDLEKISYYNIKYMDLTGKYDRAIELIGKFRLRYDGSPPEEMADVMIMQADMYEAKLNPGKTREILADYMEKFPNAKNINDVRTRLIELK